MRSLLIIAIILLMSSAPTMAQVNCQTSVFEDSRKALYSMYGKPDDVGNAASDIVTHEVGDTMTFWTYDLSVMPPAWIQVLATCRAATENAYVFVADNQWNVNMNQADVELVSYYWEEGTYLSDDYGIYELNTSNFGMPPDSQDDDDHIYLFYSELGSFAGSVFDGYFSVFNQYTEAQAQGMGAHSNEVEMFYMSCNPGNPTSPLRISVLAHEFEHMIHWAADPDEDSWVDEGCAEYAMLLFGVPDPIVNFPNNPDNNLTIWNNEFADYVKTFLFFTYTAEHYGGPEMIQTIVQEQQNSFIGVQYALTNSGHDIIFEELFTDWTIANFYHGRGGATCPNPDSQYLYLSIDPPAFGFTDWHTTYPAFGNDRSVSNWAADNIVFGNPDDLNNEFAIGFEFGNALLYGLGTVGMLENGDMIVNRYFPAEPGFVDEFSFEDFDFIGFIVAAPQNVHPHNYSYYGDISIGVESENPLPSEISLTSYPNPFNASTKISFRKQTGNSASLKIYDLAGRLARSWEIDSDVTNGEVVWDGMSSRNETAVSGVYFFKLYDGTDQRIIKSVMVK